MMKPADLDLLIETLTGLQRRLDALETRLDSWATVTSTAPLRIRLDRETTPLDSTPVDLVGNLKTGQRVRVTLAGGQLYITHKLGGLPAPTPIEFTPAEGVTVVNNRITCDALGNVIFQLEAQAVFTQNTTVVLGTIATHRPPVNTTVTVGIYGYRDGYAQVTAGGRVDVRNYDSSVTNAAWLSGTWRI